MSGTRLQTKNTSVTHRLPKWSIKNQYDASHIVWSNLIDSEYFDIYVCIKPHIANDSENNLLAENFDSDIGLYLDTNDNVWNLWFTTRPIVLDDRTFPVINRKLRELRQSVDSDKTLFRNSVIVLNNAATNLIDSESIDSDLNVIYNNINFVETRPIWKFIDSDAKHDWIITWDSDNNRYKSAVSVRKVNSFGPDTTGDVPFTLTKILSGRDSDKPVDENIGTVWVVENDPNPLINGLAYVFHDSEWTPIINPQKEKNDLLFLQASGGSLRGSFNVNTPTLPLHIVNKAYVDNTVKDVKQNKFLFFNTLSQVSISNVDSENFIIVKDLPSLIFVDSDSNTYSLENNNNDNIDNAIFVNVINTTDSELKVTTTFMSEVLTGTLRVFKNGTLTGFYTDSDYNVVYDYYINGTLSGMKLLDVNNQSFSVIVDDKYDLTSSYEIIFTNHMGDEEKITKEANSSNWIVDSASYDYGEY